VQFNHRIIDAFKANYNSVSLPRLVLGSGMFLASSLINHGCDATMYQVSYGTTAVFRARRPVSKGEQLTNCYTMPATNYRGKERRETLYNIYKFICRQEFFLSIKFCKFILIFDIAVVRHVLAAIPPCNRCPSCLW